MGEALMVSSGIPRPAEAALKSWLVSHGVPGANVPQPKLQVDSWRDCEWHELAELACNWRKEIRLRPPAALPPLAEAIERLDLLDRVRFVTEHVPRLRLQTPTWPEKMRFEWARRGRGALLKVLRHFRPQVIRMPYGLRVIIDCPRVEIREPMAYLHPEQKRAEQRYLLERLAQLLLRDSRGRRLQSDARWLRVRLGALTIDLSRSAGPEMRVDGARGFCERSRARSLRRQIVRVLIATAPYDAQVVAAEARGARPESEPRGS
jgi:hypothetical protein